MKIIPNDVFFGLIDQTLAETGSVRFRVKGYSMQPLLRNDRDEVTVERLPGHEYRRGDIVLFRFAGRHILHRILHTEGSLFIIRGDNAVAHEHCTADDILGVVTCIHRSTGNGSFRSLPVSSLWNHLWPLTSLLSRTKAFVYRILKRFL